MSEPKNKILYNLVKDEADRIYKTHGAYKSAYIVKLYKELGGEYEGKKNDNEGLSRWLKEQWIDVGNKDYPVYRPTLRITKDTPLTVDEIDKTNLINQIDRKQEIKNEKLKPFKSKDELKDELNINRFNQLILVSNPEIVKQNMKKYFKKDVPELFLSNRKNKKYMIFNPNTNKFVHFGSLIYEDHTAHNDKLRQKNYISRATNIKGNWKADMFSPNNLSLYLLWSFNPHINYKLD